MRTYAGKGILVQAFRRGGYYILRITTNDAHFVATKHSRTPRIETWWSDPREVKFERKDVANKYFLRIKEGHGGDLRLISDEPNKYVSHDGKIKEY